MKKLYSILLLFVLFVSGCTSNEQLVSTVAFNSSPTIAITDIKLTTDQQNSLNNYISTRENAVKNKDEVSFLSLFDLSDEFYYNEQKAWFTDLKKQTVSNYNLSIVSSTKIDEYSYKAALTETFNISEVNKKYTYNLVFKCFDDGYKETGIDMESIQLDGFTIYYNTTAKEYADELANIFNTKTKSLYKLFSYTPSFVGQARIYSNMTTMRGTIKPSTPDWVGGWNEYKQSIKIACYDDISFSDIKDYIDQTIIHEQIHAMLSDLSNDNLTYFTQEGFAMLFSSDKLELTSADNATLKTLFAKNYNLIDLTTLESEHLEALQTPDSSNYYTISKAYGYILYRDHGISGIGKLLAELKTNQYIELSSDDKLDTINSLTNDALKKVLDEDTTTLTKKLKDYINNLK